MKNPFLRVPLAEKMLFVKHLSIMIKSGMTLLDSLELLKKQSRSKSFKKIINELMVDIDNGQFLSASLEKHTAVFGEYFINIIRVGEASGTLAENLEYLHEELKKGFELRRKVKGAMIYPIIILVATFGISGLLVLFVFPKMIPLFENLQVELPLSTRMLISGINFLNKYSLWIAVGVVGFAVLFWLSFKVKPIRFFYHRLLLELPLIGKTSRQINMTTFSRTLSSLLKSGVKIVDAILITGNTMPNLIYQRKLKGAAEHVRGGGLISQYLLKQEKFFPLEFSQMIEVGENTGNLDKNLVYLADFYEAEVDNVFKNLSTTLEPILLLLMGVMVGFIAVSIITPIYKIAQGF